MIKIVHIAVFNAIISTISSREELLVPKKIIEELVDIDFHPPLIPIAATNITIGDLHSNTIKLLFFLVRQGICAISDKDYQRLVEIYKTSPHFLTKELLNEFNTITEGIEVLDRKTLVRLIGDELADRGSNDYFILKILQKLHKERVNIEILLSNHGAEFVEAYECFVERDNTFQASMMDTFTRSLKNLALIIKRGLISANEIIDIANTCYKPALKLISYSLDRTAPGITIYSHAGIGLQSIRLLANKFNVTYHDNTHEELAQTIDNINQCFSTYVQNDHVHELYSYSQMLAGFEGNLALNNETAVEFVLWNRSYLGLERPGKQKGYSLSFVHGHDSREETDGNIYNLDGKLGKSPRLSVGLYLILASEETPLKKPTESATQAETAKFQFFPPDINPAKRPCTEIDKVTGRITSTA